jgi:hypothetical protein
VPESVPVSELTREIELARGFSQIAGETMLYRSNTLRVLCPVICMATRSGMPARTRFRTAVRRKS